MYFLAPSAGHCAKSSDCFIWFNPPIALEVGAKLLQNLDESISEVVDVILSTMPEKPNIKS